MNITYWEDRCVILRKWTPQGVRNKKKVKKFGFGYIKFEEKEKYMQSILTPPCSHVCQSLCMIARFFLLLFKYFTERSSRSFVSCPKIYTIFRNFIVNLIVIITKRHR